MGKPGKPKGKTPPTPGTQRSKEWRASEREKKNQASRYSEAIKLRDNFLLLAEDIEEPIRTSLADRIQEIMCIAVVGRPSVPAVFDLMGKMVAFLLDYNEALVRALKAKNGPPK
jgi:hypothetical protein